jgi:hypothetical protein
MEPDWAYTESRILALKARQINAIASNWFYGSMGGACTKRDKARIMVAQMRHWWRHCDEHGRTRASEVLRAIEQEESR